MSSLVELENVTKHYRRGSETIVAVRDITLTVEPGEFVAIVGPSGSGKTTLLNLIGCVDKPDRGSLRLEGQEISALDDRALTRIRGRRIGFVFQQFYLLPTLTALENVQLPALFLRNGNRQGRAAELLERVHAEGAAPSFKPSESFDFWISRKQGALYTLQMRQLPLGYWQYGVELFRSEIDLFESSPGR